MSETCSQFPEVDESQRQLEELELQTRMERIGKKLLVLSGKGGVGKSTVAVNLAVSLALAGKKVGLLGVDLHGPSIPTILGLATQSLGLGAGGAIEPLPVSKNLSVVSVGLIVQSAKDAVVWRGPMKYKVIQQFLKDVAWGHLDYLVIDSPPGTGDEPLSVAQLAGQGASAVVVSTPQAVAIADVRRSVSFCHLLDLPVAGIIENMSGFACPHCGETIDLFPVGGAEQLAAEMGVPFLGRIPIDPQIVTSGDGGQPFVEAFAASPAAKAFAAVVQPILNENVAPDPRAAATQPQRNKTMKIAIPTANGKLAAHFGHCEQFALLEVDAEAKTVLNTDFLTPPAHEPGVLPRWLHEQGANMIIAGGMGQRAQGLFVENGIEVVVGAPALAPEAIVSAYLEGGLETGQNLCDH